MRLNIFSHRSSPPPPLPLLPPSPSIRTVSSGASTLGLGDENPNDNNFYFDSDSNEIADGLSVSMPTGHHLGPPTTPLTPHSPFLLPNVLSPTPSLVPLPPRRPPRRDTESLKGAYTTPQTAPKGAHGAQATPQTDSQTPGVLGMYEHALETRHANESAVSLASRTKADQILGLDSSANLASFYLVSGMPRDPKNWNFADMDAIRGLQPMNDSLNLWWRPDLLGSAFSGQTVDDFLRESQRLRKGAGYPSSGDAYGSLGVSVSDVGPQGAAKLVAQTMKYAHPRDIEVINSTLAPQAFCHSFTFTLPRHDSLNNASWSKHNLGVAGMVSNSPIAAGRSGMESFTPEESIIPPEHAPTRELGSSGDIAYHGVTLTVWTHADRTRAQLLKRIKDRVDSSRAGQDALFEAAMTATVDPAPRVTQRGTMKKGAGPAFARRNRSETDISEGTAYTDSEVDAPLGSRRGIPKGVLSRMGSKVGMVPEEGPAVAVFEDGSDVYWTPYAITLVSRYPIYDYMQDYLKLSWARYQKNAKHHMTQICNLLNNPAPRPGELFHLALTTGKDEPVLLESTMPGAVDFDKGLLQVDHQIWPLFQVLDLDHILTCAEVALSNSGRVIFCSRFPVLLGIAVNALKYIAELKGWNGITLAINHARDMTFVIEDPGPYIVLPPEGVVSPKVKRDKMKAKIYAAFGPHYPTERGVPVEFKAAYPRGCLRNLNRVLGRTRPSFLGERLKAPTWWQHAEIMGAIDKSLVDQHKRPNFLQRVTRTGPAKTHIPPLTAGEQHAKRMMRKRALHYVESRDRLEVKVGVVNQRLLKLMQEGEHWKSQFAMFEKHAEKLASEANILKEKIERERREAKRLSNLAHEQQKSNVDLENRLKTTELARAAAMRKLSDMQETMQDLEREREEIMDLFETRVDGALGFTDLDEIAGLPELVTEPGHQPLSFLASTAAFRRARPGTGNSVQSGMSRLTTASQAMSVLGAAGRPRTAGGASMVGRSDDVNARIASIQQKLDVALGIHRENEYEAKLGRNEPITTNDLPSVAESAEERARSARDSGLADVREASATEPSSIGPSTPIGLDPIDAVNGPSSTEEQAEVPPEAHITSTTEYRLRPVSPLPAPSISIRARPRQYSSDELATPPKENERGLLVETAFSSDSELAPPRTRLHSDGLEVETEEVNAKMRSLHADEMGGFGLEDEAC